MTNEIHEGELLESMPVQRREPTAIVATDNPYLRMAEMALAAGKVEQLGQLLDLQKKWDDEQARKAFVSAMSDFKAEAGGIIIEKSKHVSFTTSKGKTEYDHAELHDITRALVPIMAKYGLSHRWNLTQDGKGITIECVMSHRDGHSEKVSMTAPADDSGGKNTIQSIASTKTYLESYTLLAATGMATGGEIDNDGRAPVTDREDVAFITDEQEIVLRDLVDAYVTKPDAFYAWINKSFIVPAPVTMLSELPASTFDAVHNQLKTLAKEKANG